MIRVAFLLVVTACGPSLREIEDHNRHSLATADARIAEAGPPFTPATVSLPLATAAVAAPGLERDETLYADPSGQLVFVSSACVVPARCGNGCARAVEYSFHHAADGHVIVVRKRVVEQIVRRENDASCSAGCGGGTPPSEAPARSDIPGLGLGVTAVAQVELRTVTYTQQIVDRVCTNTTPVP
jgi:hypothetical protein